MSRPPYLTDIHGRPIVEVPTIVIDPLRGDAIRELARTLDVSVDRVRVAIENLEAKGIIKFEGRNRS